MVPSTRERQEFYLPLLFYFFAVLNFLLTVPHKWGTLLKQHNPEQTEQFARPAATDSRFRASSIFAIFDLVVIIYSLGHSIYRYRCMPDIERGDTRGRVVKTPLYVLEAPFKYVLCIALAFIRLIYGVASTSNWETSPARYDGNLALFYCLGYLPALIVILVLNIWGLFEQNEDIQLIRQRAARNQTIDAELGIDPRATKPWWWFHRSPSGNGGNESNEQRLLNLVSTARHNNGIRRTNEEADDGFEMINLETKS